MGEWDKTKRIKWINKGDVKALKESIGRKKMRIMILGWTYIENGKGIILWKKDNGKDTTQI